MPNPVDIIVEGGIFTYVVLFVGLIHALVWVVQLVTAKRVNLMPALWSVLLCTIIVGLLGTVSGLIAAFRAVATATPEYKQVMMAAGISVALYTTWLSLAVAFFGALANGIAGSVVKTLQRPAERA